MVVAEIELYKILKTKFTVREAEDIVSCLGQQIQEKFDGRKSDFATKEDIVKLEVKITESKADTIKWMFIFWIGQLALYIAIAKIFFHK